MSVVALDAMGGDRAPKVMVQGALRAAQDSTLEIALVGRTGELRPLIPSMPPNIHLVEAPDTVTMSDIPSATVRRKRRSSIMVGLELLKEGDAASFLSFGNTGAVMAASVLQLGRIPGVSRPAIGALFRNARGSTSLMLDVGANVDSRPAHLVEYALMGKAYFERVLHHRNPSIALLNIGEEETKGDRLAKEAHALLRRDEPNFIGNVEGNGIITGDADIVVTDGFVGNAVLKSSEAVLTLFRQRLREAIHSKPHYILGGWLLKGAFADLGKETDERGIGAAPLFGVDGTVLIGHGRADSEAVVNGLRLARRVGESAFVSTIREGLAASAVARGDAADATEPTSASSARGSSA